MTRKTGAAVALGALLLGGAGLGACGSGPSRAETTASIKQQAKCQSGLPTVTVQGNGSVEGTPNQAIISLGVQTQDATAAAAMNANATKSSAVVKIMEADGVPAVDLQTSGLSVQPNYNNAGTVITSYQVTNSVNSSLPGPQPIFPQYAAASARSAAQTPIEAGSEQVTANVTVVYQLNATTGATASTSAQSGA
jgi:uncharacterized protein YggE